MYVLFKIGTRNLLRPVAYSGGDPLGQHDTASVSWNSMTSTGRPGGPYRTALLSVPYRTGHNTVRQYATRRSVRYRWSLPVFSFSRNRMDDLKKDHTQSDIKSRNPNEGPYQGTTSVHV